MSKGGFTIFGSIEIPHYVRNDSIFYFMGERKTALPFFSPPLCHTLHVISNVVRNLPSLLKKDYCKAGTADDNYKLYEIESVVFA